LERNNRHEIVIITDSLSTIMAAESRTLTKNPKTQTIRKMLDHKGPKITRLCVPSHKGIPGNKRADQATKEALDKDISTTERYPPLRLEEMVDRRGLQKKSPKMEKRKGNQTSTERRIQKECQGKSKWQYLDSEPGIQGPPTAARWKALGRSTNCGNAEKLRTRERTRS
jgi:hypothetical protein